MKRLIVFLLPLFFFSCGGPEFVVKYKYVPPKDSRECLKGCKEKLNSCLSSCSKRREVCLEKVRREAEKIYEKQLKVYSQKMASYSKALREYQNLLISWNEKFTSLYKDYRYFKSVCKKTKDYLACERKDELKSLLEDLNENKPKNPVKPASPDFDAIYYRLSSSCPTDCGCKDSYNACFLSCGGKLVPYKFCVKNCK